MSLRFRNVKRAKRNALRRERRISGKQVAKVAMLVLVAVALALPAIFENTLLGYLPVLFYVFVMALCFAYCRVCARLVSFDEMIDSPFCMRGDQAQLLVRVRNKSVLFLPRIDLEFSIHNILEQAAEQKTAHVSLMPRASDNFHLDVRFAHIGEIKVGLDRLIVYDPLGVFRSVISVDAYEMITVTPRLRQLEEIVLNDATVEESREAIRANVADGIDYNSVRDYESGDPMKHVHWKISGRTERLYTKVFEKQSIPSLDVYVCFEVDPGAGYGAEQVMDINDAMIETALSLDALALESGIETRLVFLVDDQPRQFTLVPGFDLGSLVHAIPRMHSGTGARFAEFVLNEGTSLYSSSNIAICTAVPTDELATSMARVKATGRTVVAFGFVPEGADASQERSFNALFNASSGGKAVMRLVRCRSGWTP